jgi:crotonobetainyl-CoA:carnitine CoA-transferase CaiB-like acyl-CoA transferase
MGLKPTEVKMTLPLEGISILDSAHQYPGPYCSMLLGDMGANVIKIERPGVGDPARFLKHFFFSLNRNKQSLTLNLKEPAARDIIYRLVEQHDVFTEGFRPGVAARLGIDYETLHKINPRLVYCSISGYGQNGPYRDYPGHDLNYQAMAGMTEAFKHEDGSYVPPGVAIGDLSSGMFSALGIMAALMAREKTGKGQYIDVSMSDGLLSWMGTAIGSPGDTALGVDGDAGYGIFQGKDGKFFTLGIAHEDWFWERLCTTVGLESHKGLGALERRVQKKELVEKLKEIFGSKTRQEWLSILIDADVPVSPVNTLAEVPEDPHVKSRKMVQEITLGSGERINQVSFPVRLSDMPREIRMPPPELGEHTNEILKNLGYTEKDITAFQKAGII